VTGVKIFIDPSGFTEKLRDCQAELKMASQSFESRLNKLSRDTEQETVQLQYWATYSQASIHKQLHTIEKRIIEERMSRVEVLEKLNLLLNHTSIMDALQEKTTATANSRRQRALPDIDPDHVLTHFLYERDLVYEDCASLNKHAKSPPRTNQDAIRLAALQSNPRLRAWLTVDEPSSLIVNGRADPRPDSETSIFTARMFQQLLEHHGLNEGLDESGTSIIPLGFFCGQHRDWQKDSNGNPEELAMSLLLQLIDRGRGVLDPTLLRQCYERLRPGDTTSIFTAFESLILSLGPRVVLIIVVDGLRFFAQPRERCHGLKDVVSRLVSIYRAGPTATLKLLFVSPTKCEFMEEVFLDEEILELPRDISGIVESPARQRVVFDGQG
jgi:hypothetical protein